MLGAGANAPLSNFIAFSERLPPDLTWRPTPVEPLFEVKGRGEAMKPAAMQRNRDLLSKRYDYSGREDVTPVHKEVRKRPDVVVDAAYQEQIVDHQKIALLLKMGCRRVVQLQRFAINALPKVLCHLRVTHMIQAELTVLPSFERPRLTPLSAAVGHDIKPNYSAGSNALAAVNRLPLHPMLVPHPIGLLVGALIGGILFVATHDSILAPGAFWLLVGGLVAVLVGLLDLLGIQRARKSIMAQVYSVGNVLALVLAIASIVRWGDNGAFGNSTGLVLSFAIVLILLVTRWLGGELCGRDGIGVPEAIGSAPRIQRNKRGEP